MKKISFISREITSVYTTNAETTQLFKLFAYNIIFWWQWIWKIYQDLWQIDECSMAVRLVPHAVIFCLIHYSQLLLTVIIFIDYWRDKRTNFGKCCANHSYEMWFSHLAAYIWIQIMISTMAEWNYDLANLFLTHPQIYNLRRNMKLYSLVQMNIFVGKLEFTN